MVGTGSRTRTAGPMSKHSTTEPPDQLAVMLIFRLLTYNTDPNPTTNPNPKPYY